MNKTIKILSISILILILFSSFSASYKILTIDNLVNVVAIALDTSESTNLKLSFQFTNASSFSEAGSEANSPSTIYTIEASSISSGLNLMNSAIGKELNLSHCKLIAISQDLAMRGISDEIYTLINEPEIRPSTNLVITKSTAKYYIENSKPLFENLLTKYYTVFSNSSQNTGYTSNTTIGEFFNRLISDDGDASTILGGLNSEPSQVNTSINSQKDSNRKSNESFVSGDLNSENFGQAVFKGDKLVGELNSIENLSYLATTNQINGFLISVPDPIENDNYLDVYLTPTSNAIIDIKIVNGSPYIRIKYHFTGKVSSMQENSDYLKPSILSKISDSCDKYLQSIFSSYLYRTAKEFNSDIHGFGRFAKKLFLTSKDYRDYNWTQRYKDSFFDISVNASVRSGFLLTET